MFSFLKTYLVNPVVAFFHRVVGVIKSAAVAVLERIRSTKFAIAKQITLPASMACAMFCHKAMKTMSRLRAIIVVAVCTALVNLVGAACKCASFIKNRVVTVANHISKGAISNGHHHCTAARVHTS